MEHFKNVTIISGGGSIAADVAIDGGRLVSVTKRECAPDMTRLMLPGFADAHVHLREPGYSYKETIKSGTMAAARGGYTAVCAMPNLSPVPDSLPALNEELSIIERDAQVPVYPYGAITAGEKGGSLADMDAMAPFVPGFSDDGRGVQSEDMMRRAMLTAKRLGKIVVAHCEDERLLKKGWAVHEGAAGRFGLVGNPSESEWRQVARDLDLVRETGCRYHVCHVSTKESVALIRLAKSEGLDVTCETAPHYLTLTDGELMDDGAFRMNPPIRSASDRDALIEAVCDGTVDMIATDHAPHSKEEKSGGLAKSLNGIVGLETAFPVLYTKLVLGRVISLQRLVELLTAARRRFSLPQYGISGGVTADLTLFDVSRRYRIDPSEFRSMGRATPFAGWEVYGRALLTYSAGREVWRDDEWYKEENT